MKKGEFNFPINLLTKESYYYNLRSQLLLKATVSARRLGSRDFNLKISR